MQTLSERMQDEVIDKSADFMATVWYLLRGTAPMPREVRDLAAKLDGYEGDRGKYLGHLLGSAKLVQRWLEEAGVKDSPLPNESAL